MRLGVSLSPNKVKSSWDFSWFLGVFETDLPEPDLLGDPKVWSAFWNAKLWWKNSRISAAEMFQVAKLQIWWELFPAFFELLGAQVHEVSLDSLLCHLVICWLHQQYFFIYIFLRVSYITRTMTQSHPQFVLLVCPVAVWFKKNPGAQTGVVCRVAQKVRVSHGIPRWTVAPLD